MTKNLIDDLLVVLRRLQTKLYLPPTLIECPIFFLNFFHPPPPLSERENCDSNAI